MAVEVEQARDIIRAFMENTVKPTPGELRARKAPREEWRSAIGELREAARARGAWCPHMLREVGGMGLGSTAVAAVSVEGVKYPFGPYVINCQAPDEGNMHIMLHFTTPEQKEKCLMPLTRERCVPASP